jgi:hypothetical protein
MRRPLVWLLVEAKIANTNDDRSNAGAKYPTGTEPSFSARACFTIYSHPAQLITGVIGPTGSPSRRR